MSETKPTATLASGATLNSDAALANATRLEPIINGKYRLEGVLGEGGFAYVYKASHVDIAAIEVAIKVLKEDRASDRKTVKRFRSEAETAARLSSAHSVKVTDVGLTAGGLPYMVMEYLDGMSLNEVLRRDGQMRQHDVARIGLHVLDALEEAHKLGIVHRDIKPGNIILVANNDSNPNAVVVDFGIAKILDPPKDLTVTETGANLVFCTPQYAAPELLAGLPGPQVDLYALGHVMAEMLDGHAPYAGISNRYVMSAAHLSDKPVPLGTLTTSSALLGVVAKAVAKKLEDRWQNASEMRTALERTLADLGDDPGPTLGVKRKASLYPLSTVLTTSGSLHARRLFGPDNTPSAHSQSQTVNYAPGAGPREVDSITLEGSPAISPKRPWAWMAVAGVVVAGAAVAVAVATNVGSSPQSLQELSTVLDSTAPDPSLVVEATETDPTPQEPVLGRDAIDQASQLVRLAVTIRPENSVALSAVTEGVHAFIGDRPIGELPLLGAYVPGSRPLNIRFVLPDGRETTIEFSEPGTVHAHLGLEHWPDPSRDDRERGRDRDRDDDRDDDSQRQDEDEDGAGAEADETNSAQQDAVESGIPTTTPDLRNPYE